jgi:hypothetical protein
MYTNARNLDHWLGDKNRTEAFEELKEVWQYGTGLASEEERQIRA